MEGTDQIKEETAAADAGNERDGKHEHVRHSWLAILACATWRKRGGVGGWIVGDVNAAFNMECPYALKVIVVPVSNAANHN